MATINISTLAETLDATPRTVRKFMRDVTPTEEHPGKGARWTIEKREVRSLKSKFARWSEERAREAEEASTDATDD